MKVNNYHDISKSINNLGIIFAATYLSSTLISELNKFGLKGGVKNKSWIVGNTILAVSGVAFIAIAINKTNSK